MSGRSTRSEGFNSLQSPKSNNRTCPRLSIPTFSGLRSRKSSLWLCKYLRARAMSYTTKRRSKKSSRDAALRSLLPGTTLDRSPPLPFLKRSFQSFSILLATVPDSRSKTIIKAGDPGSPTVARNLMILGCTMRDKKRASQAKSTMASAFWASGLSASRATLTAYRALSPRMGRRIIAALT